MAKPAFIPLAAGVQTELTAQLVQPGATLVMENCVSDETGKTHVRLGSDVLSSASQATLPSGGTLPLPWQMATLGGSLVRFNRAPVPIHTWASGPSAYVAPAATGAGLTSFRTGPIKVDVSPVNSGAQVDEEVLKPTVAAYGDVIVGVFQTLSSSAANGTAVVLMDRATRRPLLTRQTGSATNTPRVAIVNGFAVVAYQNATNLVVDNYNLTTCVFVGSATLGAVSPGDPIDIRAGSPVSASHVGIIYRDNAGLLQCASVLASSVATNQTFKIQDTTPANVLPNLAHGWLQDLASSGKYAVMVADTTNGVRVLWDIPSPTASVSIAVRTDIIDASVTASPSGGTAGVRNLIGSTVTNSTTGRYRVLYEVTAPALTTKAQIRHAVWNLSSVTLEPSQFRSVGIRSKLWVHSTGLYFLAAWDGEDQRTYFVLRVENSITTDVSYPAVQAVALPRDAGGLTESVCCPSDAAVGSDGEIFVSATSEIRTESVVGAGVATGVTDTVHAIEMIRIRHAAAAETELSKPAEFLRSLFVPGGSLGQFDGQTYALAGFPYYPSPIVATSAAGGNLEPSSEYGHRALYSFTDRSGRKWRSTPSTPVTSSTTGANFKFDIDIETLRLFDRGSIGTLLKFGFEIELYRTQANATEGYFQVCAFGYDPTVTTDIITVTDNVADDDLGEQLYTDGNGVENQLLPQISCAVEHQSRLIIAEAGTGTLWYSVEADFDHGLIFNEALTLDVGDPSDPITGLAVYGETLFVWKSGKIYIVPGQGANALGQGATYAPRLIDGSVGCTNPQSIVVADDGVWFRSSSDRAGIHRTAGGSAEYVGQGVRAFDSLTLTSAVVVRSKTEIRWYSNEGTTLVWNWTTKSWGWNTAQACLSATTGYAGATGVVYAPTDGTVLSEATASSLQPYKEGAGTYLGRIRSPWYQGAGIAGWERVRRIQGVGSGGSNHRAVIALYKDLAVTPFQNASIVFDSFRPRWDWEIRPAQEKYSALMIEVTILPYQAPDVVITPGGDSYDGIDPETGGALFTFPGYSFSSSDVGSAIIIVGSAKAGTYTITVRVSAHQVVMTPGPGGGTGVFVATTITLIPALAYTAGPGIVGVSLLPAVKEGMDKLPAARRLT